MPLLEELGYIPTEKYAHGPEILKHVDMIAQKWDLTPKALFQTEVKTMDWDDKTSKWTVRTDNGDEIRSTFIVTANGILHKLKLPGVPGIESFKGQTFHTSRWDYDITGGDSTGNLTKLADKTIGIIGTGATAVQLLPQLTRYAKKVYVFKEPPPLSTSVTTAPPPPTPNSSPPSNQAGNSTARIILTAFWAGQPRKT
jgi:cyclohexanone monooxygenase